MKCYSQVGNIFLNLHGIREFNILLSTASSGLKRQIFSIKAVQKFHNQANNMKLAIVNTRPYSRSPGPL